MPEEELTPCQSRGSSGSFNYTLSPKIRNPQLLDTFLYIPSTTLAFHRPDRHCNASIPVSELGFSARPLDLIFRLRDNEGGGGGLGTLRLDT